MMISNCNLSSVQHASMFYTYSNRCPSNIIRILKYSLIIRETYIRLWSATTRFNTALLLKDDFGKVPGGFKGNLNSSKVFHLFNGGAKAAPKIKNLTILSLS